MILSTPVHLAPPLIVATSLFLIGWRPRAASMRLLWVSSLANNGAARHCSATADRWWPCPLLPMCRHTGRFRDSLCSLAARSCGKSWQRCRMSGLRAEAPTLTASTASTFACQGGQRHVYAVCQQKWLQHRIPFEATTQHFILFLV